MSARDIFETTNRPKPTTQARRDYWASYPDAFNRLVSGPPKPTSSAAAIHPHLEPASTSHAAARGNSAPRRGSVEGTSSGCAPSRSPFRSGFGGREGFFSAEQAERGAVSPLERLYPGGVAR